MPRFRNKSHKDAIPVKVQVEEIGTAKDLIAFQDNNGFILTKEESLARIEQLKKTLAKSIEFYNIPDVNKLIDKSNKETEIEIYTSSSFNVEFEKNEHGKYLIPTGDLRLKTFNPNKRRWSFTCSWCGQKVSSNKRKDYYTVNFPLIKGAGSGVNERACSKDCAQLIWKDVFKNWLYTNEYQDFFDLN